MTIGVSDGASYQDDWGLLIARNDGMKALTQYMNPEWQQEDMDKAQQISDKVPRKPDQSNFDQATSELGLNRQEQALYQRHLTNLYGSGGVDNEDGSRSTLFQITKTEGDKTYSLPTVYEGKILKPAEAVERARQQGLENFPSYGTHEEAEARYSAMHHFMEKDSEQFQRGNTASEKPVQAIPGSAPTLPSGAFQPANLGTVVDDKSNQFSDTVGQATLKKSSMAPTGTETPQATEDSGGFYEHLVHNLESIRNSLGGDPNIRDTISTALNLLGPRSGLSAAARPAATLERVPPVERMEDLWQRRTTPVSELTFDQLHQENRDLLAGSLDHISHRNRLEGDELAAHATRSDQVIAEISRRRSAAQDSRTARAANIPDEDLQSIIRHFDRPLSTLAGRSNVLDEVPRSSAEGAASDVPVPQSRRETGGGVSIGEQRGKSFTAEKSDWYGMANEDYSRFKIKNEDGVTVANARITKVNGGKGLVVNSVYGTGSASGEDESYILGTKAVKGLVRALKVEYPDAEYLVASRVSGARRGQAASNSWKSGKYYDENGNEQGSYSHYNMKMKLK